MKTRELDRLLCERLGIEPNEWMLDGVKLPLSECHALQKAFPASQWVVEAVYPGVSSTGDGMVLLMEALSRDWLWCLSRCDWDERRVQAVVFRPSTQLAERWAELKVGVTSESAPLALALAAARALEIEVPE